MDYYDVYDADPDELRRAIQARLSEAPPIACDKCNVNTNIQIIEIPTGFNIVSVCPKCRESFIVIECQRVIVSNDPAKGMVQ